MRAKLGHRIVASRAATLPGVLIVLIVAGALLGGSAAWSRESAGARQLSQLPRLGGARLNTRLARVAAMSGRSTPAAALRAARETGLDVVAGSLRVVVVPRSGRVSAAEAAIVRVGGRVEAEANGLIQARVPPSALERLASAASIGDVRPPAGRVPQAVDEGVARTGADDWHTAGFGGTGVKVAIIDLGFYGYASLLGSALPGSVTTVDHCGGKLSAPPASGGTEHGTAVAEIVHQMAPGAQLYLMCVDTEVDLALAEQDAIADGVRVVNHSVAWFNTSRGDGSGGAGTPDAIAADARAHGILWVNAAGDFATQHWSGTYQADVNYPDLNDFSPFDYTNDVVIDTDEEACLFLKWDDWPKTSEDFDLALIDEESGDLVAFSTNDQAGGPSEPTEDLCYTNTGELASFGIVVLRYSAVGAPRLDLFYAGGSDLQYATDGGVVEPASSPVVLGVGAVCWQNLGLESFTSRGPTIDGRTKPDLTAPDSVSTVTYGDATSGVEGCGTSGFAGTSAASPHVAGAAALLLQQKPGLGVAALEGSLIARSEARRAEGTSDSAWGSGVLALGHPIGAGTIVYSGYGGPVTVDADGAATKRIVSGSNPSWSTDGSKILLASGGIKSVNADGTGLVTLYGDGRLWQPAWSPNGSKVAYVDTNLSGIWVVNVATQVATQLTSSFDDGEPVWSPDGTQIAYVTKTGGSYDVWVMHADGTVKTQLTHSLGVGGGGYARNLAWSRDGTKIAFVVAAGNPVTWSIWVMNANGSSPHEVIPGGPHGYVWSPEWSPDGTQLLFSQWTPPGLGVANADGTGARLLMTTNQRAWPNALYTVDTSAWTSRNLLVSVTPSTISGTAVAGEPLQIDAGIWGDTNDSTFSYDWQRCSSSGTDCAPIAGAGSRSYVATSSDVGSTLKATVTATNSTGSASSSALSTVVGAARPNLLSLPTIAGTTVVGNALSVSSNGAWTGAPTFTFGWRRCASDGSTCSIITGATAASYTLTAADIGSTIRAAVTATNVGGVTGASSVSSAVVAATAKLNQSITFPAIPAKTFGDPDFIVVASTSSGLPVAFAATGQCTMSGALAHLTGAGSCSITVSQAGNGSYNPASPASQTIPIARANQVIVFAALANRTYPSNDFGVSASASSGLAVSFAASGSCAVTGTTIHLAGVGACTVTATQSGNASFNPASPVAQTFAIGTTKVSQTITFHVLPGRTYPGNDFTVTASASSGLAVSFTARRKCTAKGTKIHLTGIGTCTVTASQPGDSKYAAATDVSRTFAIKKAAPKCVVPNVVGKRLAVAKYLIKRRHCGIGVTRYVVTQKVKQGVVLAQSKRAGRRLAANAKIGLTVGRRPAR